MAVKMLMILLKIAMSTPSQASRSQYSWLRFTDCVVVGDPSRSGLQGRMPEEVFGAAGQASLPPHLWLL